MKTLIAIVLFAALAGTSVNAMEIATRGQPRVVILQEPNATATEQTAANELTNYLHQITGATFDIQTASATNIPDHAILVGPGPAANELFPKIALDQFGPEEFVMRTKRQRLLLAGGRPRGTIYAVYHFLQEACGVRWWTPWATNVPHQVTLQIPDLNKREKPAFEYRDPFWFTAFDPLWKVRNGANGERRPIPPELGGCIKYKGFAHTFYELVPPGKYFASHPEWFSLINGKRTADHAQLCLSNPELRDFVVNRVKEWLRESPDAKIVSVTQNDCQGACQCTNCQAIDQAQGSPSGSMIAFVNYVAEKIAPEFPDVAVDTFAYQYTRHPPRTLRPRTNVIVRLCSIECNFGVPLDDPSNTKFLSDLKGWSKICHRLYIWDYVTDFSDYLLPHPNWFVLGPNLRLFAKYGVQGVFEEGAYGGYGAEMGELRAWVLAQLLWNPQQNDRALIEEFIEGYYGKAAAQPIRRYLDLMHEASKGYYLGCFTRPHAPFLTFKVLAQAEQLWQQAEEASANDPEKLERVQMAHLPVRFAFLRNWVELRKECQNQKAKWPLPESRKAVADQFAKVCQGIPGKAWTHVSVLNEPGLTVKKFLQPFAHDPPPPGTPAATH